MTTHTLVGYAVFALCCTVLLTFLAVTVRREQNRNG